MKKKKLINLIFVFTTLTSVFTFADSGKSTIPQDPNPFVQFLYDLFGPETQTSYKLFNKYVTKVSDIKQQADSIIVIGSDLTVGGGLLLNVTKKFTIPGKVVSGVGGVLYFYGKYINESLKNIKDDAVLVRYVYFKWINPDPDVLKYSLKTESWIEYNGKRISDIKRTERDDSFWD